MARQASAAPPTEGAVAVGRPGSPFDAMAAGYDAAFTNSVLGRTLRQTVWARLERLPLDGRRWLDLGCGSGEDALWLCRQGATVTGIDASPAMLSVTAAKRRDAGLGADRLRLSQADLNEASLADVAVPGGFDGALANFGVLNCVADLPRLGATLADLLRPGAPLLAVTMGPFCAWETFGSLAAGRPRRALRRWRLRAFTTPSGTTPLRYPSPAALVRSLSPRFAPAHRPLALGLLLPPTDGAAFIRRRPALVHALGRGEAWIRAWPGAAWLSDHYVTLFLRRAQGPTIGDHEP